MVLLDFPVSLNFIDRWDMEGETTTQKKWKNWAIQQGKYKSKAFWDFVQRILGWKNQRFKIKDVFWKTASHRSSPDLPSATPPIFLL